MGAEINLKNKTKQKCTEVKVELIKMQMNRKQQSDKHSFK